jgi:hypothetical protein
MDSRVSLLLLTLGFDWVLEIEKVNKPKPMNRNPKRKRLATASPRKTNLIARPAPDFSFFLLEAAIDFSPLILVFSIDWPLLWNDFC